MRLSYSIRLCLAVAFCAFSLALAGASVLWHAITMDMVQPPSFASVREGHKVSEAVLLDRHGLPVHVTREDYTIRALAWSRLEDISPALISAVLEGEDRRFHTHHGVDWIAALSASYGWMLRPDKGGVLRGASTISMQLTGLIDRGLKPAQGRRTLREKLRQMRAALMLEAGWSKEEILEAYLNLVSFRGELVGIEAASEGLFGKEPSGLDLREAAVLAALLRSPGASSDTVGDRAIAILEGMGQTACGMRQLTVGALGRPYSIKRPVELAPHLASKMLTRPGQYLTSTLDLRLQSYVLESLNNALAGLSRENVSDGAVLVLDNVTGEVLAYVANQGAGSSAPHVDALRAARQAGSTLKPFLYGRALEGRLITAASLLEDSPVNIPTPRGLYSPGNYDNTYRGLVSAREALASSMNAPAVRLAELVGPGEFAERLKRFGFDRIKEGEHYGASIALGTVDVSLWDLTNAYRALANGGLWQEAVVVPGKDGGMARRALSREAAYIVSDILSDREARSATFGLENPLATRYWSAVKTGTSKDMRDNWCVGYSDKYTVGVWVGNFDGSPMRGVSGISGAAPVWVSVMDHLHRDRGAKPSKSHRPPKGLVQSTVYMSPSGQSRLEWFIKGTETRESRAKVALGVIGDSSPAPRIVYPAPHTIIALDPDMPKEVQRVFFEAEGQWGLGRWALDGEVLDQSVKEGGWEPASGQHTLSLLDAEGRALDSVSFEVR